MWRRRLVSWFSAAVIAAAFAVLVVAGASRDLFLVGVADSAVMSLLDDEPAGAVGVAVSTTHRLEEAAIEATDAALEAEVAAVPGLGAVTALRFTGGEGVTVALGSEFVRAQPRIVTAPGLLDRLEVIEQVDGPGVHLTEEIARSVGAEAGDVLRVGGLGPDRAVPVAGIVAEPDRSSTAQAEVLPPSFFATYLSGERRFGPALLVVEPGEVDETFPCVFGAEELEAAGEIEPPCPPIETGVVWTAPLDSPPSSAEGVDDLLADYRRIERRLADPRTDLGGVLVAAGSSGAPPLETRLVDIAREAEAAVDAARPAVGALRYAGLGMGLATVVLAATFVAARRRDDFFLGGVDGTHPFVLGLRRAASWVPAATIGLVVGAVVAPAFVRWSGPPIDASWRDLGGTTVLAVWLAGLLAALAAGTAVAAAAAPDGGPDVSRLRAVPWDLLVYGLAAAIFVQTVVRTDDDRGQVDALVVLLPIVGVAALVLIELRLLRLLGRVRRGGASLRRPVLALGTRRVTAAAPETIASIVLLGIAAGVAVFATSLVETSDRALEDKAVSAVGGRTVAEVRGTAPATELPAESTVVGLRRASLVPDRRIRVMVIDHETWAAAVSWSDRIGIEPDSLVTLLGEQTGDAIPAVAVGDELPSGIVSWGPTTLPVDVVATVPTLPLVDGQEPTLAIRADLLDARFRAAFEQQLVDELGPIEDFAPYEDAWVPPSSVLSRRIVSQAPPRDLAVLAATEGVQLTDVVTRVDFFRQEDVVAQRWAFDYFAVLALLGLVTVVGAVAVWVSVRHRSRLVALALLRRMGLGRLRQALVMVVELALSLGAGLLLGIVAAVALLRLSAARFEPLPEIGPPAEALLAVSGLLTVVLVVVLGALSMVVVTQVAAARTPTGQVLRGR